MLICTWAYQTIRNVQLDLFFLIEKYSEVDMVEKKHSVGKMADRKQTHVFWPILWTKTRGPADG
jgi:hypothetical protein